MTILTPNRKTALEYHEQKAQEVKNETKRVSLKGGPFDGQVVRIKSRYMHFATTVPEFVAEMYPPFEFDGIPDLPEELTFVAYYDNLGQKQFSFKEIRVYKQNKDGLNFPYGYEKLEFE